MATTPKISTNRLNMVDLFPTPLSYRLKSGIFKPRRTSVLFRQMPSRIGGAFSARCNPVSRKKMLLTYNLRRFYSQNRGEEPPFMQHEPRAQEFDIEEGRRVLGDVFAPWVQDLGLSIGSIECAPPPVDQTTHFMRAVTSSDVLADARVVRVGRTMSFGRVTLSSASDNKPVAMVSSAFAML